MKLIKWGVVLILSFFIIQDPDPGTGNTPDPYMNHLPAKIKFHEFALDIYHNLDSPELNFNVFEIALKGYLSMKKDNMIKNKRVLSVVDFSKSGKEKRFFVIDLKKRKVIFKSLVAHGRNSGSDYANRFSNIPESYKSSLGFYITNETYRGKHGLSLRLDGKEKSINDNARKRDIVIHGADYVSDDFIRSRGRLGRSFGCPALPVENTKAIIKAIKNKSCLFVYYPDHKYLNSSPILSNVEINDDDFQTLFDNELS